jgi:hypothetical protein
MIIGVLAGELEKISEEISATESRVVEKLVELLTPEPITGPFPAHALIRALPVQPEFTIDQLHQFYAYKKRILPGNHGKTEEKSVFFTPTAPFKLFRGKVQFQASGKKLFKMPEEQHKEVLALSRSTMPLPPSNLWLGLELHESLNSIEGLSLCFDLRNAAYEESFYNSLARGKWTINGHPLQIAPGYNIEAESSTTALDTMIKLETHISAKICRHVNNFYRKKFLTLSNGATNLNQLTGSAGIPPEFKGVFKEEELEEINKKLYWVRIELPDAFPADMLDDVNCSMNCFPVINRQRNEFTQTSREFINIIPLQTDDAYLDIISVSNTEGEHYALKSFSKPKDIKKGSYLLRQGGVGRFDSRNAKEIINYLLELLRDESAAFSVLGVDMISSMLRELNQTITRLEGRLSESDVVKENTAYLMLRANPDDETVFVEFWSTQGTFSNHIKAGTPLNIYEGSDIVQDSATLITSSLGGRERLDTQERLSAYRKTLLSRGRVVTAEDIKALCYEHFGKGLEKVEIKKGTMKSPVVNQGFVRTIDIHIHLDKRKAAYEKEELKFLQEDLLVKLEEQSANVLPYRVYTKHGRESVK